MSENHKRLERITIEIHVAHIKAGRPIDARDSAAQAAILVDAVDNKNAQRNGEAK